MKAGRKHYEDLAHLGAAARLERMEAMKGRELIALWHYAEGREPGETRDAILGLVLVVAGERYLAKQEANAVKRVKRIF